MTSSARGLGRRIVLGARIAACFAAAQPALAAEAASAPHAVITPSGDVGMVRQIVVHFSEEMATHRRDFGAAEPVRIQCDHVPLGGSDGHWSDPKTYTIEIEGALVPHSTCTVAVDPALRSTAGVAMGVTPPVVLRTAGPGLQSVLPAPGEHKTIVERQSFALLMNGPMTPAEIVARTHCEVSSGGAVQRLGVVAVPDDERAILAKALRFSEHVDRVGVVACERPLPPGAHMRLEFAPEASAAVEPQRIEYTVRSGLSVRFEADCGTPWQRTGRRGGLRCDADARRIDALANVDIVFSRPVPVAQAMRVRLQTTSGERAPTLENLDVVDARVPDPQVTRIMFAGPFHPGDRLLATVPANLVDNEGTHRVDAATALRPIAVVDGLGDDVEAVSLSTGAFAVRGRAEGAEVVVDSAASVRLRGARVLRVPSEAVAAGGFDDAAVMRWLDVAERYRSGGLQRRIDVAADLDAGIAARSPSLAGAPNEAAAERVVSTSAISLLDGQGAARPLVPRPDATSDHRLAALRIAEPGLHLVEVGYDAPANDEVVGVANERGVVLVTDLDVHLFRGSNGVLAWLTSRSTGKPVAGATVQMSDCGGHLLAGGRTDDRGGLWMDDPATPTEAACPRAVLSHSTLDRFVTARLPASGGLQDLAFMWASWNGRYGAFATAWAHDANTVQSFAGRNLLAPGQTAAMKHWLRQRTLDGWELPPRADWPTRVVIVDPAGDEISLPLAWSDRGDAQWQWPVPASARRGHYDVILARGDRRLDVSSFEVRDFRVPEIDGALEAIDAPWHAGGTATVEVSAHYFNGGPAVGTTVELDSTLLTSESGTGYLPDAANPPPDLWPYGWDRGPARRADEERWESIGGNFMEELGADPAGPLLPREHVNPHQSAVIDATGHARFSLPTGDSPLMASLESWVQFADPDGEVRRLRTGRPVWPSTRRIGIKLWPDPVDKQTQIEVTVLDLHDRPIAGAAVRLDAAEGSVQRDRLSFGDGFEIVHERDAWHPLALPPGCRLMTDANGHAACTVATPPGSMWIDASVADASGALARTNAVDNRSAAASPYGHTPFATPPARLNKRASTPLPLEPLKVTIEPGDHRVGDTVHGSVSGYFDHQSAMLLVETEGVLDWKVVELDGADPAFSWAIDRRWMPNAAAAVGALDPGSPDRGQGLVGERPAPVLRVGLADVPVDTSNQRLAVDVKVDAARVRPGGTTRVQLHVTRADGSAAPAGTRVALAVVDDALFALLPNNLHELEEALLRRRPASVTVAGMQFRPDPSADRRLAVVGATMYRANGDTTVQRVEVTGSRMRWPETAAKLRSVFDTSLAWLPEVALDASGSATIPVTANDSLAHWRVIAIADGSTPTEALLAGSGETAFDTRQPLQLTAGLPPVVHTGDTYRATLTLRNDTDAAGDVRVTARAGRADLAARTLRVAAHARVDVDWDVHAPAAAGELAWEFGAAGGALADRVEFRQQVIARVPATVRQATLGQVSGTLDVPLLPLDGADASLTLRAMPSLGADLPGVAAFFRDYRYRCLEQRVSLAVGQRDAKAWQGIVEDLASYLDGDDLPSWFPPVADAQELLHVGRGSDGSDVLASYVVSIAGQARAQGLPFALSDVSGKRLVAALTQVAYGALRRDGGVLATGTTSESTLRRLAAVAALARGGMAQPAMMNGIAFDDAWPTSALLDLREIVADMDAIPDRDAMRQRLDAALRARLDERGSRASLVARRDDELPDLMGHGDVDAVRLALLAVRDPAWRDLAPRLVAGALARQERGHWATTVANAWGTLLMAEFSKRFEAQPVAGTLAAGVGGGAVSPVVDWRDAPAGGTSTRALASGTATTLHLAQRGTGAPWVSVLASAAVPVTRPGNHGFAIRKTLAPVTPRAGGVLERGDIVRVHLDIESSADATWVVVDDPLPAGASVSATGLFGRDPERVGRREWRDPRDDASQLAYVDQRFDRYQAFFSRVRAGHFEVDYTMRLDTAGRLGLPATRVEAMYAPEMFGEWPNAAIVVAPH